MEGVARTLMNSLYFFKTDSSIRIKCWSWFPKQIIEKF